MIGVATDGGLERYDDLHVDQIDAEWALKRRWLDAGLEAHRTALELRMSHQLDLVVVLAFSLTAAASFPFNDRRELEAAFDWSPPSLYLSNPGEEPWRQPGYTRVEQFDPTIFRSATSGVSASYVEFRQPDTGELCRTVYVAA
jgi:hypothetical protein